MVEEINERFPDEEILLATGFDDAIIGIDEYSLRVVYSVKKCIEILVSEGETIESALEHFYYNVSGSYVGEKTPIWCYDMFEY
jgi:hypothetical protein